MNRGQASASLIFLFGAARVLSAPERVAVAGNKNGKLQL